MPPVQPAPTHSEGQDDRLLQRLLMARVVCVCAQSRTSWDGPEPPPPRKAAPSTAEGAKPPASASPLKDAKAAALGRPLILIKGGAEGEAHKERHTRLELWKLKSRVTKFIVMIEDQKNIYKCTLATC